MFPYPALSEGRVCRSGGGGHAKKGGGWKGGGEERGRHCFPQKSCAELHPAAAKGMICVLFFPLSPFPTHLSPTHTHTCTCTCTHTPPPLCTHTHTYTHARNPFTPHSKPFFSSSLPLPSSRHALSFPQDGITNKLSSSLRNCFFFVVFFASRQSDGFLPFSQHQGCPLEGDEGRRDGHQQPSDYRENGRVAFEESTGEGGALRKRALTEYSQGERSEKKYERQMISVLGWGTVRVCEREGGWGKEAKGGERGEGGRRDYITGRGGDMRWGWGWRGRWGVRMCLTKCG